MEEVHLLLLILDVGINKEGVCFTVDVFNGDLESVEASCLGRLDLGGEVTGDSR